MYLIELTVLMELVFKKRSFGLRTKGNRLPVIYTPRSVTVSGISQIGNFRVFNCKFVLEFITVSLALIGKEHTTYFFFSRSL